MSNKINDDAGTVAKPAQNQNNNVTTAINGVIPNAASVNSSKGTAASPGPAGTQGKYETPGRRTYNPLSKLSSYTYNFSLYMVSPDEYDAFLLSGRKKINSLSTAISLGTFNQPETVAQASSNQTGAFLIAQSGGINNTVQQRAPGFDLDYYIDDVTFTTSTTTMDSGIPAFIGAMTMNIVEPYGFSFLTNLKKATLALQQYSAKSAYKTATGMNALRQFFVLGIRFYGYDKNGAIVKGNTPLDNNQMLDPENSTEALFERFYDVLLTGVKFNINGRTTTYKLEAFSVGGQTMIGTKRGRIKIGAECVGNTVEEMLIGEQGLLTSIEKEEVTQSNKNPPDRKIPNRYKIKAADEETRIKLLSAKMSTPADLSKYSWTNINPASTATQVNDYTAITALPNSTNKKISFAADTSIVQAISSIVQKSEFMVNALASVYNNVLQPSVDGKGIKYTANPNPTNINWFTISTEVKIIDWDPLISDWAYEITYILSLYETPALGTPYSNLRENYYGPHKYLNYFFTGQNSEVLDFSLTYNLGYQNIILTSTPATAAQAADNNSAGTYNGAVAVTPGTRSGGDATQYLNTSGEAQTSVVTLLTDPTAYNPGKMTILGDPDFLMRDQLSSIDSLYKKFYGDDLLTIDAHGGFVFVEVIMKEARDYENFVGLLNLNENIQFQKYPKEIADVAKGIIFRVDNVVSTFTGGRFTQVLAISGNLPWAFREENPEIDEAADGTRSKTQPGPNGAASGQAAGNTGTVKDQPLRRPGQNPLPVSGATQGRIASKTEQQRNRGNSTVPVGPGVRDGGGAG